MRYLKSLSLLFLVISGATTQAAIIEQASIDKKAAIIEKKMIQDRYIFYGLTGLGIAYQLSQSFVELKKAFDASSTEQKTVSEKAKTSILETLKAIPVAFKAGLRHLVCTQEGWVATLQVGVAIGSSMFISKICEKFAHPDTLRWYINTHAPYRLTIKMMRKHLSDLQDQALDQKQLEVCKEIVDLLFERLVRQGELVCAYMTYKTKYLDDEEEAIAERATAFMLKSHNEWLERISVQLSSDNYDGKMITILLEAYEAAVRSQVTHFAIIEGETPQERSVVKNQIKQSLDKD